MHSLHTEKDVDKDVRAACCTSLMQLRFSPEVLIPLSLLKVLTLEICFHIGYMQEFGRACPRLHHESSPAGKPLFEDT